ncbi:50S ribosomal protein L11 methyltransferase [bacterium]|nr:50S ribosomal protein L11 methyltransferase [bacterium]
MAKQTYKYRWLEARIDFESSSKPIATDLISDIFYELGAQGVVIDDPDVEAEDGWWDENLTLPEKDAVIGYLPVDEETGRRCKAIEDGMRRLKSELCIRYRISYRELDEKDWAESWKEFFWPEKISERIVVKPTWRGYAPNPNEIVLEIDPGMAFGTGLHPTTRMCINLIEKYLRAGQSFLDIGTGSGILMVAAAKLGAGKVAGIDIDDTAVKIARDNLRLNGIMPEIFEVRSGHLTENIEDAFDVVAANIVSGVIIDLLCKINHVLKKSGLFICSGIITEDQNKVIEGIKRTGFEIVEVLTEKEWVCIAGRMG